MRTSTKQHCYLSILLTSLLLAACGGGGGSTGSGTGATGSGTGDTSQNYTNLPTLATYLQTTYPNIVDTATLNDMASYTVTEQTLFPGVTDPTSVWDGLWTGYFSPAGMCIKMNGTLVNQMCSAYAPWATTATSYGTYQFSGTSPNSSQGWTTTVNGPYAPPVTVNDGNLKVTFGYQSATIPGSYPFMLVIEGTAVLNGIQIYENVGVIEGVAKLTLSKGQLRFNPCEPIAARWKQYITKILPGYAQAGGSPSTTVGLLQEYDYSLTPNANNVAGCKGSAALAVTTFAGSGAMGAVNGTGTTASFYYPDDITTDGTNLYVADTWNHNIRKVEIATGVVTTLAGSLAGGTNGSVRGIGSKDGIGNAATFNYPRGITTDGTSLYVADTSNNKIRKIVIATAEVTTLAGSGAAGAVDGTGVAASFNTPSGVTTDGTNLYVADWSNIKIRKIVISTGEVTTFAGSGAMGAVDGIGTAASFKGISGITTDGTNLYVTDSLNSNIRKIVIATGMVSTLAGSGALGAVDGTGTAASFNTPTGITTDGTNLYVADFWNNKIRRIVIATSAVSTWAGSGAIGAVDGTGMAASFNTPTGITTDGTNLYVADTGNSKIRKIQ